jgi:hypothetical protein
MGLFTDTSSTIPAMVMSFELIGDSNGLRSSQVRCCFDESLSNVLTLCLVDVDALFQSKAVDGFFLGDELVSLCPFSLAMPCHHVRL